MLTDIDKPTCYATHCNKKATEGAHMYFKNATYPKPVYIIPVCEEHHQNGKELQHTRDELKKYEQIGEYNKSGFKPYDIETLINDMVLIEELIQFYKVNGIRYNYN